MVDTKQILTYLAVNKKRYQKDFHLIKVGVFGSIARGEQREGSDIDLLVEFEDNTEDLYAIKQMLKEELQEKFNSHVDICREKYINPIFKKQILSEAIYA